MDTGKAKSPYRVIARNRQAARNYELLETVQAGIELLGTEVKACRSSKVSLDEGFAQVKDGEIFLMGVHISPHGTTNQFYQHQAKRPRRLLLHKKEILRYQQATERNGMTIVPTQLYFNEKNMLKVQLALGKGKNLRDKRDDMKDRDSKRDLQRMVKIRL